MKSNITRILSLFNLVISTVFQCSFILILCISAYFLIDSYRVNISANNAIYKEYRPSDKDDNYSYKRLVNINNDVSGWIKIRGTKIDYPIVHAADNKKYLTTNVLGKYESSGSIFVDCENSTSHLDFNTIIYGHHMKNGEMFGDLDKFDDEQFFNNHLYGELFYADKRYRIQFFAYINDADGYDSYIYKIGINRPEDCRKYIDNILNNSKYKRNVEIDENSNIILLSTCSGLKTNGRIILAGKIFSSKTDIHFDDNNESGGDKFYYKKITLALLCFVLIIIVYGNMKKRRK